jgi:hypothetical protein
LEQHPEETPKILPFPIIRDTLDPLAEALTTLLDREFPQTLASIPDIQPLLLITTLAARNTYAAIRFLAADFPKDASRQVGFGLTIEPLARSLADLISTLVFMREDLPSRVRWFHQGGWRELKEEFDRHCTQYGKLPEWQDWLQQYGAALEGVRQLWGISEAEAAAPKKMGVKYWPTPAQMLKEKHKDRSTERNRDFLTFLNDWVYRGLSANAHMSAAGIVRRHAFLLLKDDEGRDEFLTKFKSDGFFTATTLMVAICTEVNSVCKFGRDEKIAYLWRILVEYWPEAKDLFERQYSEMLART